MPTKYQYVFWGKNLSVSSSVLLVLFGINFLIFGGFLLLSAIGMVKFGEDYLSGFGWLVVVGFLSISIFTNLHRVKVAKYALTLISFCFLLYGIFDSIK